MHIHRCVQERNPVQCKLCITFVVSGATVKNLGLGTHCIVIYWYCIPKRTNQGLVVLGFAI